MIHIIIPTYQRYEYVKSLLCDISHQTYKDFTVHVCSDGPDMNIMTLVSEVNNINPEIYNYSFTSKRYGDWGLSPRKMVLNSLENDEDLVVFIDDDNTIQKTYLEVLYANITRDPDLEVVFGQVYLADHEINGERIVPTGPLSPGHVYSYGYVDPLCMMMKVKVAKQHISEWASERDGDYKFMSACMRENKFIFVHGILGVHR